MARRLVEAGVRFVTVHYDAVDGYSWDSHQTSDDVRHKLLPTFDQAFSALVEDLESRGLLDETLVVALGEMGRSPQANASWGRGHWSQVFPAVLAGAGIRGGVVHGSSNRHAGEVVDAPTTPEDLAATIYHALGIDPDLQLPDAEGRPIPIVHGGRPLRQLFG
jgi:arylsulfatase A-like enzyme